MGAESSQGHFTRVPDWLTDSDEYSDADLAMVTRLLRVLWERGVGRQRSGYQGQPIVLGFHDLARITGRRRSDHILRRLESLHLDIRGHFGLRQLGPNDAARWCVVAGNYLNLLKCAPESASHSPRSVAVGGPPLQRGEPHTAAARMRTEVQTRIEGKDQAHRGDLVSMETILEGFTP